MATPVILIGYGGHGYVATDILLEAAYTIGGYCDNEEKKVNPFSIPYKGKERDFFLDSNNCCSFSAFIAIGNSIVRKHIFEFLIVNNVSVINAIHPSSTISKQGKLGKGIFIAAHATINACCSIGNGVICNTSSSIDHECTIGDFTHICPGAVLCGNVTIGKNSFIGANSTIIPGITIADDVIVGAGSTVIHDLLIAGVYAGSPAKLLRKSF
ncbi:MAG: sugar O-acyltransferase, sialic acid O-acetyltransferase NeuD family [Segetibacter sp.]|nr:sugar O-acyltransferase, sialic acid O-acetyltransferase NeuD family [Segetibacter sp.]